MQMWLARTIFASIFTALSFNTIAVESNVVVNTLNKPFVGGEHLLITSNGKFGIAAGEGKLIVFNTQKNTLERVQEISLQEFTSTESKVASANFSPTEELLFLVFENYRLVEHHQSLVFIFDNMTGNVKFLRNGPNLSGKAVFSDAQNIIYDAVTYSDFDGTDNGNTLPVFDKGPQINAYQYSQNEDILLWSQRYNIENLVASIYTLGDKNYVDSISFLADEQYLTLTIANETNEFITRFLFKLAGPSTELVGSYVPSDYVYGSYSSGTSFFGEVINGRILALKAAGYTSQEDDYYTLFLDISAQNPTQLYELDGNCKFVRKRFNPQEHFSCRYDQSGEEGIFMFDDSNNLVEVTGQGEISTFEELAHRLDDIFEYPFNENAVTRDKALTYHRGQFPALSLFEIDENQRLLLSDRIPEETLIDIGFTNAFSTPTQDNQFTTILPESEGMIVKSTSNEIEPVYRPISLGRPSEIDSIGLLNENTIYRFTPYIFDQREPLQFFRILEDGMEELTLIEDGHSLLPEGFEFYTDNGQSILKLHSHLIALAEDTLVFTAVKNADSAPEYAVFSVQVMISGNQIRVSETEQITTTNSIKPRIVQIPTRRAFFVNTQNESLIFENASEIPSWQKIEREKIAGFEFISPDGIWLTNTRESKVYLRNINWQEGWKIVEGDQAYFLPGGEWLLTFLNEASTVQYYKLVDGEWTYRGALETNFSNQISHPDRTKVFFPNENHVYLVNNNIQSGKSREVRFQILHWQFSAPTIIADEASLDVGGSATLDLIQNDIETDNPIDITSLELTNVPSQLEATIDGSDVTFKSNSSQSGVYELLYRVADTYGNYAEPVAIKVKVIESKVDDSPNNDVNSGSSGGALNLWWLSLILFLLPQHLLKTKTN